MIMSRPDEIKQLITNHRRRLQKLKEKQALYGIETPVRIEIEIEDVEVVVLKLEAELATLESREHLADQEPPVAPSRPVEITPAPAASDSPQPTDREAIFVGRQTQLAALDRYWEAAIRQNQGRVIFLTGEAGIGKTSLVAQFSRRVKERYPAARYAYAQCDQVAGDISPYAPFIQILNSLTEQAAGRGGNWTVEYLREVGPDILEMVPVAGPLLAAAAKTADFVWQRRRPVRVEAELRSGFGQEDIFQQFTDTIRNIARNKNPLLLFIDDWHWADTSSANLLFHLARRVTDVPLLLLATYRPHDAQAREHPILKVRAELKRYQLCSDLPLDFLSRNEVETYLSFRFPDAEFKPDFLDWLMKTTSGNALFTTEYINLLMNEELLTPSGDFCGDFNQLIPPENVEAIIQSRLGYLDREARDMLAYGSVEGEQFTTLLLGRLLEIKSISLIRRLRTIEETHHLITSLGHQNKYEQQTTVYQFAHALIYRTLYDMLETEERIELNRLMLELLAEIYDSSNAATKARMLPELMTHAAECKDYQGVAEYALEAANIAATNYAFREAAAHSRIGAEALDKITASSTELDTLRLDLLLCHANAENFAGNRLQAIEIYRQAQAIARTQSKKRLAQVLNNMAFCLREVGEYHQAKDYYIEAVSVAEQAKAQKELVQGFLGLGFIDWKQGDFEQALQQDRRALAIAEEIRDQTGTALCYKMIGYVYTSLEKYAQALENLQQAVGINKALDNKLELVSNYNNIGFLYYLQDDISQAMKYYQRGLALAIKLNFRIGAAPIAGKIGLLYQRQGDTDTAMKWYKRAFKVNKELDNKQQLAWNYYNIGSVHQANEDYDRAMEFYRTAVEIWQSLGHKNGEATTSRSMGLIYEDRGEYQSALECYRRSLAIWETLKVQSNIKATRRRIAEVEAMAQQDNQV